MKINTSKHYYIVNLWHYRNTVRVHLPAYAWTSACVHSQPCCSRHCSYVSGWCWVVPGDRPWSWGWTDPHCERTLHGRTVGCRTGERVRALGPGEGVRGVEPGCAGDGAVAVEAHQQSPDERGDSGRKAGSAWRRPAVAAAGIASRWWCPSGSAGSAGGHRTCWSRQSQLTTSHRPAAGCSGPTPGRHRLRCSARRSCPCRRWRPGRSWACPPTAG